MATCLYEKCKKEFVPERSNQKFCPGGACRTAYNNEKKGNILRQLAPRVAERVEEVANGVEMPVLPFLNTTLWQVLGQAGETLSDSEIWGGNGEAK